MGWTCQHDYQGQCKLLGKPCTPGTKGCTINKNAEGIIFSQPPNYHTKEKLKEPLDYTTLSRSH